MITGIAIAGFFIILSIFITYIYTKDIYKTKFENEMTLFRRDYDRSIGKLEDTLQKLSAKHQSLEVTYENVLRHNHSYETLFEKMLKEKAHLLYQTSKFQKELYTARKRIKKLIGSRIE